MHGYPSRLLPALASRRSLAARGQFLNTFAGLGFCTAFSLLAMGGYLIEERFENPIQDQSAELLFAALLIATATKLLYCLPHCYRKSRHRMSTWHVSACHEEHTVVIARSDAAARIESHTKLQPHGRFVDRTVVRIRH